MSAGGGAVVEALRGALGGRVRTDEAALDAHRADSWVLAEWRKLRDEGPPRPLAVVEASDRDDVAATLRIAREHGTAVLPYGGGSGVCGAVEGRPDAVVLSLRPMQGLVRLDDADLCAVFRAGTLGGDAERAVQRHGLTIGHWPQSIELSTVGGWVATRASGQFSTAYGNIEDVVLALEAVLPDGSLLRTRETPRASAGPDLRHLLLGSEGAFGVVTEVTFSLRPLPEASRGQALHFGSLRDGLEALRHIVRAGWRPPVMRLYDPRESRRGFRDFCPKGRALLLLLHEGPAPAVEAEVPAVRELGRALGGEAAPAEAVDHWLAERNHVPSFRSFLEQGVVVDTIEVATTWSRVADLYDAVTGALSEVPGVLAATAHSSHSYRSGTNLYFSFAARPDDPAAIGATYAECWRRTMEACLAHGAGIAHHHGVGRVRRDWLAAELGESGAELLRRLKRAVDPDGLLNPGAGIPPPARGAGDPA